MSVAPAGSAARAQRQTCRQLASTLLLFKADNQESAKNVKFWLKSDVQWGSLGDGRVGVLTRCSSFS